MRLRTAWYGLVFRIARRVWEMRYEGESTEEEVCPSRLQGQREERPRAVRVALSRNSRAGCESKSD